MMTASPGEPPKVATRLYSELAARQKNATWGEQVAFVVGVRVNSLAAVPLASRDHLDLGAAYNCGRGHSVRFRTFDARIWFAFRPGIAARASAIAWRAGKTEKRAAFGQVA